MSCRSTLRLRALLWFLPVLPGLAVADTLSSQSSVGIQSEYASNPFMLPSGGQPAESIALLANVPLTYTSNTQTVDFTPRLRYAQTHGPVALLSNYQYLDADWHWNSERNTLVTNAGWHHDSTLYNEFENASLLGHDLTRLEQDASVAWQRALTERSDLQLSGSWDRVTYSHNSTSSLDDYRYAQGALEYDRNLTERWRWGTAVGYGQYALLSGNYLSDDRFAQTTLNAQWSELWATTAQVGYAYLSARALGQECCQLAIGSNGQLVLEPIAVVQVASRGAPNFLVSARRKAERLELDLSVSRAIQPSGLGELLTQDDASLRASIPWTERLTLGTTLHWSRLSDALGRLDLQGRHYYELDLTGSWQWTEYWNLDLQTTYIDQALGSTVPQRDGVTVYATLSRRFGQLKF